MLHLGNIKEYEKPGEMSSILLSFLSTSMILCYGKQKNENAV